VKNDSNLGNKKQKKINKIKEQLARLREKLASENKHPSLPSKSKFKKTKDKPKQPKKEEIKVLKENDALPSTYPPFDGIPRLKKATVEFIHQFLDIHVSPTNCIPTVGAMHGCFISQAIAGRRKEVSDTILFIDPGFPVNKLQTQFLGLKNMSIDLCDYRGNILGEKLEEIFLFSQIFSNSSMYSESKICSDSWEFRLYFC